MNKLSRVYNYSFYRSPNIRTTGVLIFTYSEEGNFLVDYELKMLEGIADDCEVSYVFSDYFEEMLVAAIYEGNEESISFVITDNDSLNVYHADSIDFFEPGEKVIGMFNAFDRRELDC